MPQKSEHWAGLKLNTCPVSIAESFNGICVKKYKFDRKSKVQVLGCLKTEISFVDRMASDVEY